MTGFETRVTVLGHVQRGGTPTAYDRVLGTRFGVGAADLAAEGKWGTMVALRGRDIVPVTLEEACASTRGVDEKLFETAEVFFG
jgi:6-phosphofructokinase 1